MDILRSENFHVVSGRQEKTEPYLHNRNDITNTNRSVKKNASQEVQNENCWRTLSRTEISYTPTANVSAMRRKYNIIIVIHGEMKILPKPRKSIEGIHLFVQTAETKNNQVCVSMIEPLQNTMDQENQVLQNGSVTTVEDTIDILDLNEEDDKPLSTTKAVIILAAIFLTSLLVLGHLYYTFPKFKDAEKQYIKIPFSIEDAKNLGIVLDHYKETNYVRVLLAISFCSILFALPGSFALAILSGYLYPFPLALGAICFSSAMGSTFCYLLSLTIGRKLAYAYFPDKIKSYASLVKKHEDNVLFVIMFWRIIPFFPSWIINVCAPLVNVPLLPFWFGTFIGVAVPSGLSIQAGKTLKDLSSTTNLWSWSSVLFLVTFATLSLLPILYKAKLRDKFD